MFLESSLGYSLLNEISVIPIPGLLQRTNFNSYLRIVAHIICPGAIIAVKFIYDSVLQNVYSSSKAKSMICPMNNITTFHTYVLYFYKTHFVP